MANTTVEDLTDDELLVALSTLIRDKVSEIEKAFDDKDIIWNMKKNCEDIINSEGYVIIAKVVTVAKWCPYLKDIILEELNREPNSKS